MNNLDENRNKTDTHLMPSSPSPASFITFSDLSQPSSSSYSRSLKPHHHSYRLYPEKRSSVIQERREEEMEVRNGREQFQSSNSSLNSSPTKSSRIGSFLMSVTLSFVISLTLVYYFSPFIAHHLPTLSSSTSKFNQFFPQSLSRIQEQDINDISSDVQFSTLSPELIDNRPVNGSEEAEFNRKVQMISLILPDDSVVVSTISGKVLGYKVKELSTTVSTFLGIPYARPPVGPLRFRKPRPVVPWKGLRDATRFGHQCIQYKPNRTYTPWISSDDNMSEDCLTLNIWTPNLNQDASDHKSLKSVMLWIHGGAFFSGSSDVSFYDGRTLSAFGDVVVVTINYRLGVFGFYDAKIPHSPGNQGLYDQLLAMKWVYENIKSFGGNPESITLFGQSAGAISIGLHYLSPMSQKYFKRGILESGSPTVPRIFYDRDPSDTSANKVPELARKVGCINPNEEGNEIFYERTENILNCLRKTDRRLLESAQNELIEELSVAFGPTTGDDFLPDLPLNLLHDQLNQVTASNSPTSSTSAFAATSTLFSKSSKFQEEEDDDGRDSGELEEGKKGNGNADDAKEEMEGEDEDTVVEEGKGSESGIGLDREKGRQGSSTQSREDREVERMRMKKERIEERNRNGRNGTKKELLIGVNKDEGSFFLHFLDPKTFSSIPKNISYEESIEFVKRSFNFLSDSFSTLVTDMFLAWTKDKDSVTIRTALANMIGDSTFTCPATLFANIISPTSNSMSSSGAKLSKQLSYLSLSKVYFYVFDHSSTISPWDKWMGVLHFDEVPFVFGHPVRYPHVYTKAEISFSKLIMSYWVNFAKTG